MLQITLVCKVSPFFSFITQYTALISKGCYVTQILLYWDESLYLCLLSVWAELPHVLSSANTWILEWSTSSRFPTCFSGCIIKKEAKLRDSRDFAPRGRVTVLLLLWKKKRPIDCVKKKMDRKRRANKLLDPHSAIDAIFHTLPKIHTHRMWGTGDLTPNMFHSISYHIPRCCQKSCGIQRHQQSRVSLQQQLHSCSRKMGDFRICNETEILALLGQRQFCHCLYLG